MMKENVTEKGMDGLVKINRLAIALAAMLKIVEKYDLMVSSQIYGQY